MARAFVVVGSNIDPERNIPAALNLLARKVRLARLSTFYRTAALGSPGSPDFLNGAVEIETELEPRELKYGVLRPVEDLLGRVRSGDRNAPRPIDLDLVLYDSREARDEDIVLPDPEIGRRPFLAGPLAELAPGYVLPGETRTLREIAGSLPRDGMEPLLDFTERLRRDLDAARHAEHGAD